MRLRRSSSWAIALSPLPLLGCGGGSTTRDAHPAATKAVESVLFETGTFIEESGLPAPSASPALRAHGKRSGPWYDKDIDLWAKPEEGGDDPTVSWSWLYFEDKALTKPAGHYRMVQSRPDEDPNWYRGEQVVEGGRSKGLSAHWYQESYRDGRWASEVDLEQPGRASTLRTHWASDGSGSADKTWVFLGAASDARLIATVDGSSSLSLTTGGLTLGMTRAADGSGTGTLVGSSEGLPAALVCDASGTGTVRWSDGTTKRFRKWAF